MSQNSQFVEDYRQAVSGLLDSLAEIRKLQKQYTALDLGTTLTDADCQAPEWTVTKDQLVAAVSSCDAVETLLSAGHFTNLYRVARR